MQQYKYEYGYNIDSSSDSDQLSAKGSNDIDYIIASNFNIWNQNNQTYLSAEGYLGKTVSVLLGRSI